MDSFFRLPLANRFLFFSFLFSILGLLQPKFEHYGMLKYWLDLITSCLTHCRKYSGEKSDANIERTKFLKPVLSCLSSILTLHDNVFDFICMGFFIFLFIPLTW
jgi:hypothetical protein